MIRFKYCCQYVFVSVDFRIQQYQLIFCPARALGASQNGIILINAQRKYFCRWCCFCDSTICAYNFPRKGRYGHCFYSQLPLASRESQIPWKIRYIFHHFHISGNQSLSDFLGFAFRFLAWSFLAKSEGVSKFLEMAWKFLISKLVRLKISRVPPGTYKSHSFDFLDISIERLCNGLGRNKEQIATDSWNSTKGK